MTQEKNSETTPEIKNAEIPVIKLSDIEPFDTNPHKFPKHKSSGGGMLLGVVVAVVLAVFISYFLSGTMYVKIQDDQKNISGIVSDITKIKTDALAAKKTDDAMSATITQYESRIKTAEVTISNLNAQLNDMRKQLEELKLKETK